MEVIPVTPDKTSPVIRGLRTEDSSQSEETITYDVRFYAYAPGTKKLISLIINVEAQQNYNAGYPLAQARHILLQPDDLIPVRNRVHACRVCGGYVKSIGGSVLHRQRIIKTRLLATISQRKT